MIDDGLDPEAGTAQDLQLRRVHRPADHPGLQAGVRGRRRGHDLHEHGRGHRPAVRGACRVRPLLPHDRRHRQGRPGPAAAAPQPQLPRQLGQRLGAAPGPVLRRGRAVQPSVHALHDRASATGSTGSTSRRRTTTTPTTSSGTRSTRATSTCSRTTARCSGMAMLRAGQTDVNTEDAGPDRGRPGRRPRAGRAR